MKLRCFWMVASVFLVACGPSTKDKARIAEEKRVECLDKFCEGDTPPQTRFDEVAIKLNGQWFIAPRAYSKGLSGLAFYWPSREPVTSSW